MRVTFKIKDHSEANLPRNTLRSPNMVGRNHDQNVIDEVKGHIGVNQR